MLFKDQLFPLLDNPKSPLWEDKHEAAPSRVGHQGAQCERNRSSLQSESCGELFIWSLSVGFMEAIRSAGKWGEGQRDAVLFLDMMTKVSESAGSAWWLSKRAKQLIVNREEWRWGMSQTARRVLKRQHCFPASCFSAENRAQCIPGHRNNENTGTGCTSVQSGPTSARKNLHAGVRAQLPDDVDWLENAANKPIWLNWNESATKQPPAWRPCHAADKPRPLQLSAHILCHHPADSPELGCGCKVPLTGRVLTARADLWPCRQNAPKPLSLLCIHPFVHSLLATQVRRVLGQKKLPNRACLLPGDVCPSFHFTGQTAHCAPAGIRREVITRLTALPRPN